jgi:hypothetical protein
VQRMNLSISRAAPTSTTPSRANESAALKAFMVSVLGLPWREPIASAWKSSNTHDLECASISRVLKMTNDSSAQIGTVAGLATIRTALHN